MNTKTRLLFAGISHPVDLAGCDELLSPLSRLFAAWPHRRAEAEALSEAIISIRKAPRGEYRLAAPWLDRPLVSETTVELLCNLGVDLVNAYFRCHPSSHCLHAAAARFADGLVVFPNTNKAGKSVLTAALARSGLETYGDDLLAVSPEFDGMAFGIPPRLRKPLPASEPELAEFVRGRVLMEDSRYCYLDIAASRLAAYGSRRRIGAVVLLDRRASGDARLLPADRDKAMDAISHQQFLREGEAMRVLAFADALTAGVPCWELCYADTGAAVAALAEAFARPSGSGYRPAEAASPRADEPSSLLTASKRKARSSGRRRTRTRYVRQPGVTEIVRASGATLVGADGSDIFRINQVGRAVWELLREPSSIGEVTDLLAEVFPGESRKKIASDVGLLFDDLRDNRLIAEAP